MESMALLSVSKCVTLLPGRRIIDSTGATSVLTPLTFPALPAPEIDDVVIFGTAPPATDIPDDDDDDDDDSALSPGIGAV